MGNDQSRQAPPPEQLSRILAERFATKCFTPLELTHFKDNFFTRAIHQGGLKYWNEKTLSDFLGIPDQRDADCPLDAGPVIFRMVSYLGAFPFQNTLAPCLLTFESMVKVVVLLTARYRKVLRRGRIPNAAESDADRVEETARHARGFDIDEPANDGYEDDEDDDFALAAFESLDDIEVFKHDSRIDRRMYEARISPNTFRRLLMLLLVIAPLKPLEDVGVYSSDVSEERMDHIRKEADNILAAFGEGCSEGISYRAFTHTITTSFPGLFDPLTPLFEHFLFSKNLDLSQKRKPDVAQPASNPGVPAGFTSN
ncbi:hypothetical protein BJX61DRAFT_544735 [Aspergillus egyptiacus]|nr:hypothetical protein BJX61DRAFT_544735 [Aspergillus egyptiacus]